MLVQRIAALRSEKESLEQEVSRGEVQIKGLTADKMALQSDLNAVLAQRDRLVVQKKQLRVRPCQSINHPSLFVVNRRCRCAACGVPRRPLRPLCRACVARRTRVCGAVCLCLDHVAAGHGCW
jgi:hypothetical protein